MNGRIRATVLQPPSTNWVPAGGPTLKLVDSPEGGKEPVEAFVVEQAKTDLLEVVGALGAASGLAPTARPARSSAIKTAMIAITTKSSIKVKAGRPDGDLVRSCISFRLQE